MGAGGDVRAGGQARLCRGRLPEWGLECMRARSRLVARADRGGGGAASERGLASRCARPQWTRAATTVAYQSNLAGNTATSPRIWVLVGPRAGDRSQLLALADSLGWPYEVKELAYNRLHNLPNWLMGASLRQPRPRAVERAGRAVAGPDHRRRQAQRADRALDPGAGRRRRRAGCMSAAPGRRWRASTWWWRRRNTGLPPRPNVVSLAAPLHRVTPERLADAAAAWKERLQHLPRPLACAAGGRPFARPTAGRGGGAPAGRSRQCCGPSIRRLAAGDDERAHERRGGRGAVRLLGAAAVTGIAGRPGRRTIRTWPIWRWPTGSS